MNPLHWRREHQVAFGLTIFLGALAGLTIVLIPFSSNGMWIALEMFVEGAWHSQYDESGNFISLVFFDREVLAQGLGLGGLFAGLAFYIFMLVRNPLRA